MQTNLRIVVLFAAFAIIVLFGLPLFFSSQVSEEIDFILPTEFEDAKNNFLELQKFRRFNGFLSEDSLTRILFYYPYSGVGSSMEWNKEDSKSLNSWIKIKNTLSKELVYEIYLSEVERFVTLRVTLTSISSTHTMVKVIATTEEIPYFTRYFNYYIRGVFADALNQTKTKMIQWYQEKEKKLELIKSKPGTIQELELPEINLIGEDADIPTDPTKFHETLIQKSATLMAFLTDSLRVKQKNIYPNPILLFNDVEQLYNPKAKLYEVWVGYRLKEPVKNTKSLSYRTIDASKFFVMYLKGKYGLIEKISGSYESYFSSKAIDTKKHLLMEFMKIPPSDSLEYEIQAMRW